MPTKHEAFGSGGGGRQVISAPELNSKTNEIMPEQTEMFTYACICIVHTYIDTGMQHLYVTGVCVHVMYTYLHTHTHTHIGRFVEIALSRSLSSSSFRLRERARLPGPMGPPRTSGAFGERLYVPLHVPRLYLSISLSLSLSLSIYIYIWNPQSTPLSHEQQG